MIRSAIPGKVWAVFRTELHKNQDKTAGAGPFSGTIQLKVFWIDP